MYFKIEPSGCSIRKGAVQVRFCLFLEPGDVGYEQFHVQVPVIPPEGYSGPEDGFKAWLETLPKKWQNNPFHNHFCQFSEDATDAEIAAAGQAALDIAYGQISQGAKPYVRNLPVQFPKQVSGVKQAKLLARLASVKTAKIGRAD